MPLTKLREYLDDHGVEYIVISHSRAFTAQKIAAAAHISGKDIAKTVMVRINGKMAMVVLPASKRIDFHHLKGVLGSNEVEMASEEAFKSLFPSCETGAMPPFGNLYGLEVFLDKSLVGDHDIAFNAGSHSELVQMKYRDFEKLVLPKIINFSVELV